MYKIDKIEHVKAILMSYEKLSAVASNGTNFAGLADMIIDIDNFIDECSFSKRQSEILNLYYFKGYTQTEVADILQITQQGVSFHLSNIDKKIKDTLKAWKRRGN